MLKELFNDMSSPEPCFTCKETRKHNDSTLFHLDGWNTCVLVSVLLVGPLCLAAPQLLLVFYKEEGCERGGKTPRGHKQITLMLLMCSTSQIFYFLRAES